MPNVAPCGLPRGGVLLMSYHCLTNGGWMWVKSALCTGALASYWGSADILVGLFVWLRGGNLGTRHIQTRAERA